MPGSRYKFRIKAENCYGISDPGEESDAFDVAPGERLYIMDNEFLYGTWMGCIINIV